MYLEFTLTVELPGNTTLLVGSLGYNDVMVFITTMQKASVYKGDRNSAEKFPSGVTFLVSAVVRDYPNEPFMVGDSTLRG